MSAIALFSTLYLNFIERENLKGIMHAQSTAPTDANKVDRKWATDPMHLSPPLRKIISTGLYKPSEILQTYLSSENSGIAIHPIFGYPNTHEEVMSDPRCIDPASARVFGIPNDRKDSKHGLNAFNNLFKHQQFVN
jgi:hypothetical protein